MKTLKVIVLAGPVLAGCWAQGISAAAAAEISLRSVAIPGGTIVRLGDVADLRGGPEQALQELSDFPLMPAPAPGTKQFVGARQVRDMLRAGGVAMAGHRLTGAAQVAISGETPEALRRRVGRLTKEELRRVEDDLRESIARHLSKVSAADELWQIALSLEDAQLRQLAEASVPWTIEGSRQPWTGPQSLTVTYQTPGGTGRLAVAADVSLPEPVVVLTRPLARGDTLSKADLALVRPSERLPQHRAELPLHSLEEAVGKVLKRPLREGQILAASMIEAPTLVRRGQTVKVIAVAHGIRVETEARARQAGAEGELIHVETLDTREPFAAVVSGAQEVQVIGR